MEAPWQECSRVSPVSKPALAVSWGCSRLPPGILPSYPLPTYLSTFLSTYTHTYLSTCLPTYLSTFLSTFTHTYLPIYLHTYLPIHLPTYLPTYLPSHIPTDLLTYLATYLPTHLLTFLPILLTHPNYLSFLVRTGPHSSPLSQINVLNFTLADLHSHLRQQMVLCHGRF